MIGRVRRAVAGGLLAFALAGCAAFPDAGPREWQEKVEGVGELGGPPVVPEPGGSNEPQPPPAESDPSATVEPVGCDDPDLQVVATCLAPVSAVAVLPDARSALVAERTTGRVLRVQRGMDPVLVTTVPVDARAGWWVHRPEARPPGLRRGPARLRLRHDPAGQPGGPDRGGRAAQARADRDPPGAPPTTQVRWACGTAAARCWWPRATRATPLCRRHSGSLAGKLLRIDTLGRPAADNPDPASPIFSSGLRAPGGVCAEGSTGSPTIPAPGTCYTGPRRARSATRPGRGQTGPGLRGAWHSPGCCWWPRRRRARCSCYDRTRTARSPVPRRRSCRTGTGGCRRRRRRRTGCCGWAPRTRARRPRGAQRRPRDPHPAAGGRGRVAAVGRPSQCEIRPRRSQASHCRDAGDARAAADRPRAHARTRRAARRPRGRAVRTGVPAPAAGRRRRARPAQRRRPAAAPGRAGTAAARARPHAGRRRGHGTDRRGLRGRARVRRRHPHPGAAERRAGGRGPRRAADRDGGGDPRRGRPAGGGAVPRTVARRPRRSRCGRCATSSPTSRRTTSPTHPAELWFQPRRREVRESGFRKVYLCQRRCRSVLGGRLRPAATSSARSPARGRAWRRLGPSSPSSPRRRSRPPPPPFRRGSSPRCPAAPPGPRPRR